MNRNVLFFGLVSVTALAGALAACSSTTTTETVVDSGAPTSEAGSKDAGKDTSTPPEEDAAPTDPDKACAQEATLQACGQCCISNHTTGYKVFEAALIACTCSGTGADGGAPCAADCANTACKSPPAQPDQACNTCLQTSVGETGACNSAVSTACAADTDCVAQQKCIAPCQKKPQQ